MVGHIVPLTAEAWEREKELLQRLDHVSFRHAYYHSTFSSGLT